MKSSYHILEVNHSFCEEIKAKLPKSEYLRVRVMNVKKGSLYNFGAIAHEVKKKQQN